MNIGRHIPRSCSRVVSLRVCVCVCVCARARARACVRACVLFQSDKKLFDQYTSLSLDSDTVVHYTMVSYIHFAKTDERYGFQLGEGHV